MVDPYRTANRALWDEWTAIHVGSAFYDVDSFRKGGLRVRPQEIEDLGDVRGKTLLHLQCHFGLDTLSWARLGARVTGVDFSERAIEAARALAAETGLEARFVCAELGELPRVLDERFDVVYTSRGVLWWLPDLGGWARVIAHHLKPGGVFYINESHPVHATLDDGGTTELRVAFPYFTRPEPQRFPVTGSYADRTAQVASTSEYGWCHGMAEIVTALIGAGLQIDLFRENPWLDWPQPYLVEHADGTWRLPPGTAGELPLSFSLRARRP